MNDHKSVSRQQYKKFDVPNIWEAALNMLRDELDRIMWNINQEEYGSPFNNTDNRFDECSEFIVEAYSWDDNYEQPYNFKWRDVEINWYKYLGREMRANKELTPNDASIMLDECLGSLMAYEKIKDLKG